MRSSVGRAALAGLGVALGLVAVALAIWHPPEPGWLLPIPVEDAIGWAFVGAGFIGSTCRPANRTGPLLTLTGLVWFCRQIGWWEAPLAYHMSHLALVVFLALVVHQLVVFPRGRPQGRAERALVLSAYGLAVGGYLASQLFYDPMLEGCLDCSRNLLLVHGDQRLSETAEAVPSVLATVLVVAVLVRLVGRWRRASPPGRR